MRNRLAISLLAFVTLASVATSSHFEPTVYKTRTGEKYHNDGCRYLRKSKIAIKLSEAKREGLTACSVCLPPRYN